VRYFYTYFYTSIPSLLFFVHQLQTAENTIFLLMENIFLSRVLPLQPLGHQAARYGADLSPSLQPPARHQTHLDSITSCLPTLYTVCHSLWFLPQSSLFLNSCLCANRGSCFVLCFVYLIKTLTPWFCFPTLSAHRYISQRFRWYNDFRHRHSLFFHINWN
jgi:hypothetical protein